MFPRDGNTWEAEFLASFLIYHYLEKLGLEIFIFGSHFAGLENIDFFKKIKKIETAAPWPGSNMASSG